VASDTPKRLEFDVAVAPEGAASTSASSEVIPALEGWAPDHLLLVALCRCTLGSLAFHMGRAGLGYEASAVATGAVTRDEDGVYRFVETEIRLDVRVQGGLPDDEARSLARRAERGCFVGNSLRLRPTYRWTFDGKELA
jgi:organic hydroperoxide reductase OsmC/OhrA